MFESRLVAQRQYQPHSKNRNEIVYYIHESGTDNILRVADDLINSQNIENDHLRKISSKYVKMSRKNLNERYINKKMHGYFRKQLEKDNNIDREKSNSRPIDKNMTSHFEGYNLAKHAQELLTKYLKNKRDRDNGKQTACIIKFKLCKINIEDVVHIISGCPNMSSRYYLPVRHDVAVKYLFQAHIKKNNPGATFKDNREYEFLYKVNEYEYWPNISITKYHTTNQM